MYKLRPKKTKIFNLIKEYLQKAGVKGKPMLKDTEYREYKRDAWLSFYTDEEYVKTYIAICAGSAVLRIEKEEDEIKTENTYKIPFEELKEFGLLEEIEDRRLEHGKL